MLGAANWELVQRRWEALKPQISKHYAHLCAQKVKFTKQIKDITDDNKVTHKLLDKNRSWYRPSHANRGSGRGRAGFRGSSVRGRGSTNRPFLRATFCKDHGQVCKMEKSKSLKLCHIKALMKLFKENTRFSFL